jgi:hypothetical protein
MSFLETLIFLHVVEVVSTDNNSVGHLGGNNHTLDDTASDGDVASERAFLIDVISFNSFTGGFESKSNILPVADTFGGFLGKEFLGVQE